MLTWQFVGIMFVLSESAEALLPDEFGTVGGITGAVLGLLLLPPIKRFAGGISERERNLLTHLRESLGISIADADAIESQLQSRTLSFG